VARFAGPRRLDDFETVEQVEAYVEELTGFLAAETLELQRCGVALARHDLNLREAGVEVARMQALLFVQQVMGSDDVGREDIQG